jgi:hypothetical protein
VCAVWTGANTTRREIGRGQKVQIGEGNRRGKVVRTVRLEVLSNLTDETLERELADEELGGPGAVSTDSAARTSHRALPPSSWPPGRNRGRRTHFW